MGGRPSVLGSHCCRGQENDTQKGTNNGCGRGDQNGFGLGRSRRGRDGGGGNFGLAAEGRKQGSQGGGGETSNRGAFLLGANRGLKGLGLSVGASLLALLSGKNINKWQLHLVLGGGTGINPRKDGSGSRLSRSLGAVPSSWVPIALSGLFVNEERIGWKEGDSQQDQQISAMKKRRGTQNEHPKVSDKRYGRNLGKENDKGTGFTGPRHSPALEKVEGKSIDGEISGWRTETLFFEEGGEGGRKRNTEKNAGQSLPRRSGGEKKDNDELQADASNHFDEETLEKGGKG